VITWHTWAIMIFERSDSSRTGQQEIFPLTESYSGIFAGGHR
jgi:hypothetical protein